MFHELTYEELRELDSAMFGALAKADYVWTNHVAQTQHPMVQEMAQLSFDVEEAKFRARAMAIYRRK